MLAVGACNIWPIGTPVPEEPSCPAGQTSWLCTYNPTPCFAGNYAYVCASSDATASTAAAAVVRERLRPKDPSSIVISGCDNTWNTTLPRAPMDVDPELTPQGACGSGGAGAGGGAAACGQPGDPCGLDGESDCCSGICALSVCD